MGLLDVLNGMPNGPRGQLTSGASGGGMSPITMAILGLIAYKALKRFSGSQPALPARDPALQQIPILGLPPRRRSWRFVERG